MNTYIFVTNQYLPAPGATGVCVHQLAKQLVSEGKQVTTICWGKKQEQRTENGETIIEIKIPFFLDTSTNVSVVAKKARRIFALICKLIHIKDYPLRSNILVNRYIKTIEQEIQKSDTDVTVVASFTPIEAVVAVGCIKEKYGKKLKAVYYSADTLSNEQGDSAILPASFREKKGIQWEKKLFSVFDKILIMQCHKSYYFSDLYKEYQHKMHITNFPLLTPPSIYRKSTKRQKSISLVYAGTLYKVLRNPQFLCDCLIELSRLLPIQVDFLGGGDCDDILQKASAASNSRIHVHGMQPHKIALQYLQDADILLSIGNAQSPMAPSKIYEYMSTGKPIIHVYSWQNDPCIEPLQRYGNALLLKSGDDRSNYLVREFVQNAKTIPYNIVEDVFKTSTPKYTIDIISNI